MLGICKSTQNKENQQKHMNGIQLGTVLHMGILLRGRSGVFLNLYLQKHPANKITPELF